MNKLNRNIFMIIILIGCVILGVLSYKKLTTDYKNGIKLIDKISKNEEISLLYIRDKESDLCKLQEPQLSLLGNKYNIKSYIMEVGNTTNKQYAKLLNKLSINTDSIAIPSLVVVKDGKAIDGLEGLNGVTNVFDFLKKNNFIQDDNMPLNYINSDYIDELNNTNENYILVLGSYRIDESNDIESKLWNIASENEGLTINYLSLSEMTETQGSKFEEKFGDYFKNNKITGKEVLIVNNGQIVDSISEDKEKDDYINLFKNNGLIYGE